MHSDRLGKFEPVAVSKRQVVLTEQLEQRIISMFGRSMSYLAINEHLQEIYVLALSR